MESPSQIATVQTHSSQGSPTLKASSSDESATKRRNEIHFVMQGKGGVGKSFIATILAEYLSERVDDLQCYDTDPLNHTFSTFKAFSARSISLFERGQVNGKAFDEFMVPLLATGASGLIDNGATTFMPLMNYMDKMRAFEMLVGGGKSVFVHVPIAGGEAMAETVDGFAQIARSLPPEAKIVVWLNELLGPVELGGMKFEAFAAYEAAKDQVFSVLTLPAPAGDMFARDLQDVRQARMSFGQAINGANRPGTTEPFNIMERQRLTMIRRELFDQLRIGHL